jgi:hypothetical protein
MRHHPIRFPDLILGSRACASSAPDIAEIAAGVHPARRSGRVEQIPIPGYSAVDAATPIEGGAGIAAACEKIRKRTQSHGAFSMG